MTNVTAGKCAGRCHTMGLSYEQVMSYFVVETSLLNVAFLCVCQLDLCVHYM